MRGWLALVMAVALCGANCGPVAAQATPEACVASRLENGRLVPETTATGLRFAGGAGEYLSVPFDLPAGAVLYATHYQGSNSGAVLEEAPGSAASGGGLIGTVRAGQANDLLGTVLVYDAGSFVLDVDADAAWTIELEYSRGHGSGSPSSSSSAAP